jgi:hypothetical protein
MNRGPAVLLAAGMVLSLGLPWRNAGLTSGFASTWVPGSCTVTWDGYSYCDGAGVATAVANTVTGPVAGFALPARVLVVLTAVLFLVAVRRRTRSAAGLAIVCALTAVGVNGVLPTAGLLAFTGLTAVMAARLKQLLAPATPPPSRPPRAAHRA